jgi:hypothetical protein
MFDTYYISVEVEERSSVSPKSAMELYHEDSRRRTNERLREQRRREEERRLERQREYERDILEHQLYLREIERRGAEDRKLNDSIVSYESARDRYLDACRAWNH